MLGFSLLGTLIYSNLLLYIKIYEQMFIFGEKLKSKCSPPPSRPKNKKTGVRVWLIKAVNSHNNCSNIFLYIVGHMIQQLVLIISSMVLVYPIPTSPITSCLSSGSLSLVMQLMSFVCITILMLLYLYAMCSTYCL